MMLALGGLTAVPEPASSGAHVTSDTPFSEIPSSALGLLSWMRRKAIYRLSENQQQKPASEAV